MSDRGPADEENGDTANSGPDTVHTRAHAHAYTSADLLINQ